MRPVLLRFILLSATAVGFVACGDPISMRHQTFVEGQKNLASDGYWLCRLDYDGETTGSLYAFSEFRGDSRANIATQCKALQKTKECSKAISRNQYQCVRAKNLGGIAARKANTYCAITFDVETADSFEEITLDARGPTTWEANRSMIETCLASTQKDACTSAILDGKTQCTLL